MKLPDLRDFDLTGKRVLVRVDFDVPLRLAGARSGQALQVADTTRIESSLPTINHLLSQKAKIILLSHLGRPEGKIVQELSLSPVAKKLQELLPEANFQFEIFNFQSNLNDQFTMNNAQVVLLENLRFDSGEEANDIEFAKKLATLGDFYVNDAFAASHREHASMVALPQQFKSKYKQSLFFANAQNKNSVAAGLSLLREIEVLSSILENPKRPVVVILGGVKEDKLEVVPQLANWADYVLIGGKLPKFMETGNWKLETGKLVIGELNQGGKDITLETVEKFAEVIKKAGTIVWAGPMGEYEEDPTSPTASLGAGKWEVGTREIGRAVVESGAFTIIGGGDTEAALTKFGLVEKIDFVSSGGGAMLEYLANGDLPGLKALRVQV